MMTLMVGLVQRASPTACGELPAQTAACLKQLVLLLLLLLLLLEVMAFPRVFWPVFWAVEEARFAAAVVVVAVVVAVVVVVVKEKVQAVPMVAAAAAAAAVHVKMASEPESVHCQHCCSAAEPAAQIGR